MTNIMENKENKVFYTIPFLIMLKSFAEHPDDPFNVKKIGNLSEIPTGWTISKMEKVQPSGQITAEEKNETQRNNK
mgnify:CR=1 FL=1